MEVSYAITSLPLDEASAEPLLALLRNHWRIENQLHDVRDVTLGEDACRVRTGSAPHLLAALRHAVAHLLAGVPADSTPAAIEALQVNPDESVGASASRHPDNGMALGHRVPILPGRLTARRAGIE